MSVKKRLRELKSLCLVKRRLCGALIVTFQGLKKAYRIDGEEFYTSDCRAQGTIVLN